MLVGEGLTQVSEGILKHANNLCEYGGPLTRAELVIATSAHSLERI